MTAINVASLPPPPPVPSGPYKDICLRVSTNLVPALDYNIMEVDQGTQEEVAVFLPFSLQQVLYPFVHNKFTMNLCCPSYRLQKSFSQLW